MFLSVRLLEKLPSFFAESVTPGPSHWSTGITVTPDGREMEQVIVTEPPASMVEEGEEMRVMLARSVWREICTHSE